MTKTVSDDNSVEYSDDQCSARDSAEDDEYSGEDNADEYSDEYSVGQ
jgi:hypothetical protein